MNRTADLVGPLDSTSSASGHPGFEGMDSASEICSDIGSPEAARLKLLSSKLYGVQ